MVEGIKGLAKAKKPSDKPAAKAKKNAQVAGSKKAADNKPADGADVNLFDKQMFLLDYYANFPGTFAAGGWWPDLDYVRTMPVSILNQLDSITQSSMTFLERLMPHEYAQLIPAIQLYIVDNKSNSQIPIPLLQPNDVEYSITNSKKGHFYSGHTVGLKSLNMNIDGNTNPLTGKLYNVDLVLLFDSINTFFEKIPGAVQTYADVFKSYGAAGGPASLFKLKLVIQYKSMNKDLLQKYNLEGSDQTYISYLQFKTSTLSIDENLKTKVKVQLFGYEEGLLNNNDIMNFLDVDLKEEQNKSNAALKTLNEELKGLDAKVEKEILDEDPDAIIGDRNTITADYAKKAIQSAITSKLRSMTPSKKAYMDTTQGWKLKDNYKYKSWHAGGRAKAKLEAEQHLIKSVGAISLDDAYERYAGAWRKGESATGDSDSEANSAWKAGKIGHLSQELQTAMAKVAKIKETKEKKDRKIAKATASINNKMQSIKEERDNIRINAIGKALEHVIFSDPESDIKEIPLDKNQITSYMTSLHEQDTRFLDAFKDLNGKHKASSKPVKSQKQRRQERKAAAAAVKQLQKKRQALSASSTNPKTQNRKKELTSNINKLKTKGTVLDKTTFEKELRNLKKVRYIAFGKLLENTMMRGVVARCQRVYGPDSSTTKEVKKVTFLLAKIELEKLATNVKEVTELYNLPISISNLQKVLADELVGKYKTSLTMLEFIKLIMRMIQITQQKKHVHLSRTNPSNNYSLQFYTYPLDSGYKISRNAKSSDGARYGVYIFLRANGQRMEKANGSLEANRNQLIPNFFLGGQTSGVVKKMKLSEMNDDAQKKVAYFKNKSSEDSKIGIIPTFFEIELTLVGVLNFQVGQVLWLCAPTINLGSASKWFWLNAYYLITTIEISYTAGGQLQTVVGASYHFSPKKRSNIALEEARKKLNIETTNAMQIAKDAKSGKVPGMAKAKALKAAQWASDVEREVSLIYSHVYRDPDYNDVPYNPQNPAAASEARKKVLKAARDEVKNARTARQRFVAIGNEKGVRAAFKEHNIE